MKSVTSICQQATKQLEKVKQQQESLQTQAISSAEGLEDTAKSLREKADNYAQEAQRASNAIDNFKNLFGLNG